MKKKLLLLLTLFGLIFSSCGEKVPEKEEITIYHATDFHYLSQKLTENSPVFVDYIAGGDGKMTHYIEDITNAFVDTVIENKPDYLVISGDITFNGEKQSHLDFAQKLKDIEKNGVQVVVIPGNHDVDYPFAYAYNNDVMKLTDRITKEEYADIYKDFGLSQAYSKDEKTYSYFYKLTDKITLLALDINTRGTGRVHDETVEWIEKELSKINEDTTVITVTHQTLLDHFDGNMNSAKYAAYNTEKLVKLLENKNVPLNLCGHIHTQHIFRSEKIADIATQSISVTPFNYGVIKCNSREIEYYTESTNVQKWAVEKGKTDENLLNFEKYALEFYMNNQSMLSMRGLEDYSLPQEDKEIMADFFAEINTYYFPGRIDEGYEHLIQTEGYKKWTEAGENIGSYKYIMARMEEGKNRIDHNRYKKNLK